MVRAGKYQKESDGEKILELGRTYMRDAEKSEKESDYIAAESIYHMCCDIFSSLIPCEPVQRSSDYNNTKSAQQKASFEIEARGEYMHALFRYAMLPQISEREKVQYLEQAYDQAALLEKETGDVEYAIAVDCIREEQAVLSKSLQKQGQNLWITEGYEPGL